MDDDVKRVTMGAGTVPDPFGLTDDPERARSATPGAEDPTVADEGPSPVRLGELD